MACILKRLNLLSQCVGRIDLAKFRICYTHSGPSAGATSPSALSRTATSPKVRFFDQMDSEQLLRRDQHRRSPTVDQDACHAVDVQTDHLIITSSAEAGAFVAASAVI